MLYSLVTYVTKNGIGEYVIIRRIEKGLFMSESVLSFLEEKNLPEVIKKKHTYLMMDGHDQEDIYVLKDGVVKVSIVWVCTFSGGILTTSFFYALFH